MSACKYGTGLESRALAVVGQHTCHWYPALLYVLHDIWAETVCYLLPDRPKIDSRKAVYFYQWEVVFMTFSPCSTRNQIQGLSPAMQAASPAGKCSGCRRTLYTHQRHHNILVVLAHGPITLFLWLDVFVFVQGCVLWGGFPISRKLHRKEVLLPASHRAYP